MSREDPREEKDVARESGQWLGITLALWLVIALAIATGLTLMFLRFEQLSLDGRIDDLRDRVERLEAVRKR